MNCPSCNTKLHMTERKGIEIDYCPDCRGVWLDRGELDKILDKALEEEQQHLQTTAGKQSVQPAPNSYSTTQDNQYYYSHKHNEYKKGHSHHGRQKSRKPWFMELFD